MKRALAIVLFVSGCLSPRVGGGNLTSGGEPRDMAAADPGPKAPPAGTGGGATASGCDGVTEQGRCEISDKGQVAVVCDVKDGKLQRFDCSAMGKVCVIDSTRGASCAALPPPTGGSDGGVHAPPPPADMGHATTDMGQAAPPPPHDMATAPPMCPSGVDDRGYCASASSSGVADTAIWCDSTSGQTYVVNCAALGKTCQVDACANGAYCCDADTSVDMATPPSDPECDYLGFVGACQDGHARWCNNGQVIDVDCGARGQDCAVDQCAQGAYCCDPPATTTSACDQLGVEGECDGNVARWCANGQIIALDCGTQGQTCQLDTCATGAYCCDG